MLSTWSYAAGAAELLAIAAGAAAGGAALRRRLLAGWDGAPAALATIVLAIALIVWVGELLGSVGVFDDLALVIALPLLGSALHVALRDDQAPAPARHQESGHPLTLAGIAIAAV